MAEWRDISSAPRGGTTIRPGDDLGNGLVAVPVEPTPRMIEMARTCLKRLPAEAHVIMTFGTHRQSHDLKMRARWKAMLDAAKPIDRESIMQELADEAQKLGLGY